MLRKVEIEAISRASHHALSLQIKLFCAEVANEVFNIVNTYHSSGIWIIILPVTDERIPGSLADTSVLLSRGLELALKDNCDEEVEENQ